MHVHTHQTGEIHRKYACQEVYEVRRRNVYDVESSRGWQQKQQKICCEIRNSANLQHSAPVQLRCVLGG